MDNMCPLDVHFASEIAALLQSPSPPQTQEYFDNLIVTRQYRGLKVNVDEKLGKGVYADAEFRTGELVLKDQILAGLQHSTNKLGCFVCGCCFRFIGSIELQIGRKLYFQGLGLSSSNQCHSDSSSGEDECCVIEDANLEGCSTSGSKTRIPLAQEAIQSLIDGQLVLPYSEFFSLPLPYPCLGGCGEEYYCSKQCADIDWDTCHSLLCIGEMSKPSHRRELSKFIEHANNTNDIFILAAKVIAITSLRYKNLKKSHLKKVGCTASSDVDLSLLLEAWKPVSMGYKRRWWDCIALPEDVDIGDETEFRLQFKRLAFESLQLLKEAIFDEECAPLFSLEIYGHIIGMFELNNLDLVVPSPVQDYFLYVDDLPESSKKDALAVTQPILDALGDDYSTCCQGTAFFPLQSCMNHSCCPNAKAYKRDNDKDGQATIVALRHIQKGEEITISYIDEELPYDERQKLLEDYGFICKCSKCIQEKAN